MKTRGQFTSSFLNSSFKCLFRDLVHMFCADLSADVFFWRLLGRTKSEKVPENKDAGSDDDDDDDDEDEDDEGGDDDDDAEEYSGDEGGDDDDEEDPEANGEGGSDDDDDGDDDDDDDEDGEDDDDDDEEDQPPAKKKKWFVNYICIHLLGCYLCCLDDEADVALSVSQ